MTQWTAACQASLSITNSRSLLKLMSIELVMPSHHFILFCPLLLLPSIFPSIRVFSNESVLCIRWPSTGVEPSASVLPMNIQDWFPLGLTGLISLQSKGFSKVFSSTTGLKEEEAIHSSQIRYKMVFEASYSHQLHVVSFNLKNKKTKYYTCYHV